MSSPAKAAVRPESRDWGLIARKYIRILGGVFCVVGVLLLASCLVFGPTTGQEKPKHQDPDVLRRKKETVFGSGIKHFAVRGVGGIGFLVVGVGLFTLTRTRVQTRDDLPFPSRRGKRFPR